MYLSFFILNGNPIEELPQDIYKLEKLKTLGMASTLITELPQEITEMKKLKYIYVHDTNLTLPKLSIARRGVQAIKDFFKEKNDG